MKKYIVINEIFNGFGSESVILGEYSSLEEAQAAFNEMEEAAPEWATVFRGAQPHDWVIDYVINPTVYENGREEDYITIGYLEE